jgi:hypothetical protein
MPSEDLAIALGHQDGGNLARRLLRAPRDALDRIVGAYKTQASESHPKPRGSSAPVSHQESLF